MTTESPLLRTRPELGSYDDIVAAAIRTTGLSDFGGDDHEAGLRVLAQSYADDAGLTPLGFHRMRGTLKGALVARLFAQHGFTTHPEHEEVRIERPIFVAGLPRSGTTLLQRLLAADPAHQSLQMWLADLPQPRPPRETWVDNPIFAAMQGGYQAFHESNPELAGLHYTDAASDEECWRLLQQSGMSAAFETLAQVSSYSQWLAGQDWRPAYARHRKLLQLIGLNEPEKRWVLKNPSHLLSLDALFEVYPDAIVIVTHRDPVTCVASMCSLAAASTRGTSTTFTGATLGAAQLDLLVREQTAYDATRARVGDAAFLDVDYDEFVSDPAGTVQGIYTHFDLPWGEGVHEVLTTALTESRSGVRAPKHRYDLADYGLTEEQVRASLVN